MFKKKSKDLKPEKPAEDEYEALGSGRNLRGPLLWGGLLLIPIILSLGVSLLRKPDEREVTPRPEGAVEAPVVDTSLRPRIAGESQRVAPPQRSGTFDNTARGRAQVMKRGGESSAEVPSCRFSVWEGLPLSDGLKGRLEALGRPYRLLTPNSAATMDHNPERVNVDLDENNVIIRVWCG